MALSDYLSPALQVGSTILGVGGQLARGSAMSAIGARKKAAADFEATQLDQEAGQSQAVAQRTALDISRQVALVNSAALARAAASGAGASDPTVMNILSRTAGEGAYRQALAMYEGEAQGRMDRNRAAALRYQGSVDRSDAEMAKGQSDLGAAATLLTGAAKATSMFEKYWSGPGGSEA